MQKAKQEVRDLLQTFDNTDKCVEAEMKEELKPKINNLLHMHLPDDVTLKEMEAIAMTMFDMIYNPYDYVRGRK